MLKGLSGGYVDDLIRTGDNDFQDLSKKMNERFDMAEEQKMACSFTGFSLGFDKDGTIVRDQHEYLKKLEKLPLPASLKLRKRFPNSCRCE